VTAAAAICIGTEGNDVDENEKAPQRVSRKTFVRLSGVGIASAGLAACTTANNAGSNAAPSGAAANGPLGNEPEAYVFFVAPEQRFMEAAVERLIPADELGAGALQAGVAFYIDQQLIGAYGYAAKMYMQGPWGPGTPEQGYQLPLTPREVYRLGIAETNAHCARAYGGKTFDQLTADQQDATLAGLEKGTIDLPSVPAAVFFQMLYGNTVEGFFADPLYGGNRDMIGWKLVGFPGVAAYYRDAIPNYINKPYTVAPMSIAGTQQQEQMEMESSPSSAPSPSGTAADHTPLRILAMRLR